MPVHEITYPGQNEFDVWTKVYGVHQLRIPFTFSDLVSNVFEFPLKSGIIVKDAGLLVTSGFTGATAEKLGDGAADDGYLVTANIDSSVTNAFASSLGTTNAFAMGKYYPTGGKLMLTFTGTITAGAGILIATLYDLERGWRELRAEAFAQGA